MKVLNPLNLSCYVHDIQKATCTFADISKICTLNKIRELSFYTKFFLMMSRHRLRNYKKSIVTHLKLEERELTIVIHY